MDQTGDLPLAGYETLLCVTGGIACYKSADLASKLVQQGAGVTVAMTEAATKFVAPLTFRALTMRQVYITLWQSDEEYNTQHIALTALADLMIVAPATADILAKMANGIADDLVSTLALSSCQSCPVLIAPAMNVRMWQHPATQANVKRLAEFGAVITGPECGRLACGTTGSGRMVEVPQIIEEAEKILLQRPPKRAAEQQ